MPSLLSKCFLSIFHPILLEFQKNINKSTAETAEHVLLVRKIFQDDMSFRPQAWFHPTHMKFWNSESLNPSAIYLHHSSCTWAVSKNLQYTVVPEKKGYPESQKMVVLYCIWLSNAGTKIYHFHLIRSWNSWPNIVGDCSP
jgi:hypothetical protein